MRVPLLGGAYQAKSLIADAQRCVNLYPEQNPQDCPVPVTHYPTAGLVSLNTNPGPGPVRGLYTASNGDLYTVINQTLYYVSPSWVLTALGNITTSNTPVSMADNGLYLILVDGSASGYSVQLSTRGSFGPIVDTAFYGATRVDYLDTFMVLNRPGTAQFYVMPSEWVPGIPLDPLYIAAKAGYPDPLQTIAVMHREIWLIGTQTTEIWYDVGAPDFPFQILSGVFIENGCAAPYSLAKGGLTLFWVSQDLRGHTIILKGYEYRAVRVSNHALEAEFATYPTITDAIGYCYQYQGHQFYQVDFPTANKSWVFDDTAAHWHQRAWTDGNGILNRARSNCAAFAYQTNVVGDWVTGQLYSLDPNTYTDNGNPISRIRSFPHLIDNMKNARQFYTQFIADMEVGTITGPSTPIVTLRWSDTRGASWGNGIGQSMGATGQYLTNIQWRRLGMARDRVFELSWSSPTKTALNGAFVDIQTAGT